MKGLTPEEYEALRSVASPMLYQINTEAEFAIRHDLMEQGRVYVVETEDYFRWYATPAGHEALRIWPLVKTALEQP